MTFEPDTIKAVATLLMGEPNAQLSKENALRYGTNGSLSIDPEKNTFYDHEANEGGGILDLIRRQDGIQTRAQAVQWLKENGMAPPEASTVSPRLARWLKERSLMEPAEKPVTAPDEKPAKARLVASYDYKDETGKLLFQVQRFEPKKFVQRRPDGNGWEYKVQGTRQVPYRLPELVAAPLSARIYVVEGEKDADRLAALGLVATCNAGGAGKWRNAHSEHLKNRTVILIPDNDDAGRDHVQKVAKSLEGIAAHVRILELPGLPEKGDVSDWLDAGGNPAELAPAEIVGAEEKAWPALDDAADDESLDNHRNAPRPDPACLYGLVGDVARAGGDTTEANPYAVAANFIAFMGCAVGRGPYMPVGNTWHHARMFMLHIGRSGRGRKGDAVSLIGRIERSLKALSQDATPQVHRGGLSSREGLVYLIHDGYTEGKTEVEPILDKRLLVIESEFANVLHQGKREGNTLSAALRDCWDGVSMKPATKTSRLWASDPHIAMVGAVTPGELLGLMASRELTNGFANRFLMFWAERTKMLAFPRATRQEDVDALAVRVLEVLEFCRAHLWEQKDHMRVELSEDARKRYEVLYHGELNDNSAGERITALIERRAPMLLRLAMLFALCDLTTTVEVHHINAALAWVRYSVDSIKFIFGSAADEVEVAETNDTARKIVDFLKAQKRVTRKQITVDCFKGHTNKTRIDAALDELLSCNPPRIVVQEDRSGAGRPTKFYELTANKANYANNKHPCGFAGDFEVREQSEISPGCELSPADSSQVRIVREVSNQPQARMDIDSSLTSHSSRAVSETVAASDELEEF